MWEALIAAAGVVSAAAVSSNVISGRRARQLRHLKAEVEVLQLMQNDGGIPEGYRNEFASHVLLSIQAYPAPESPSSQPRWAMTVYVGSVIATVLGSVVAAVALVAWPLTARGNQEAPSWLGWVLLGAAVFTALSVMVGAVVQAAGLRYVTVSLPETEAVESGESARQ